MKKEKKWKKITSWILQGALAGLFAMAALPKLTGDPMALAMVGKLGLGDWAAYAIGLVELAAAVLLLVPRWALVGALLGAGTLAGAILSHLTVLGISLGEEDGGSMFMMAVGGLLMALVIAWFRRDPLRLLFSGEEVPGT
ncbi:MAG: DoxX family membrane protein [Verrucomicrobia bacterium]|jgi:uncharacterized membrane protein YphA (DoxX/SURF4 family)|nr:DoxX family membrane protein [Verrucomicrobiota bacterium]